MHKVSKEAPERRLTKAYDRLYDADCLLALLKPHLQGEPVTECEGVDAARPIDLVQAILAEVRQELEDVEKSIRGPEGRDGMQCYVDREPQLNIDLDEGYLYLFEPHSVVPWESECTALGPLPEDLFRRIKGILAKHRAELKKAG